MKGGGVQGKKARHFFDFPVGQLGYVDSHFQHLFKPHQPLDLPGIFGTEKREENFQYKQGLTVAFR